MTPSQTFKKRGGFMEFGNKPFDKQFVANITYENIIKAFDRSITITASRLADRPDAGEEILQTLDILNRWKKINEDFRLHNPELFGD